MMEDPQQCKNCEHKEVLELKDDLEKLGYELNVLEIKRIKELRIGNSVILTTEFMEKYFQEIDSDDKELRIELYEWINENTTFCNECGIRWINNKFDEGKTKCRDCENDENEIDIRAGIEDSESSGNKSDDEESDESESKSNESGKGGETSSPNGSENNENFEEPHEENIINRPNFDSSESSESNSEDKSEISDYNIENLFETPLIPPIPPIVPIIMGATRAEVREDFRAALLATTGHDIGVNWAGLIAANPLANAIEDAGNVAGGIINMPQFYGKEEEDVNDWVKQFETAFTAIGKTAGANGVRQAAMAATCLKGAAAQWYNERKEAGAEVKLVNQLGGQRRPPNNNNNRQGPLSRVCYNCKQPGHYANACRANNGQGNYRRPNNQNYNRGPNNYNGRPNNYNRPSNYQNNNRGFNATEFDNYGDYNDQYDYDNQDYEYHEMLFYNCDQGYDYGEPYFQNNDNRDFYNGRQTRSNIKNRSSDRDIDMEIDQEQERRRNDKYASQQQKAAALPRRGFTDESLRKAQETKRNNNTCGNCGQKGHYATQCKNERVEEQMQPFHKLY
ncbi:unnamed protein product [Rhizophagus irregularis]|nr:unnamed protein product [Rhizophagus irregularis]